MRLLQRTWAVILCGLLSVVFAVTAWTAVRGKSFTPDEPGHALVGWFMLFHHDFRFWDNNPPLWEYWIALPGTSQAIAYDPHSSEYLNVAPTPPRPIWSHRVPLWLMERGRMMCLALGVALALLIGRWAWELGGLIPAVAATFLYCFDPNFLGHAPLLKNDVGCALFYLATSYAAWKAGQRLTIWRAMAVAVLTAATILVKFSGPLLLPVLMITLGYRALSNQPWPILGRAISGRFAKFGASAGVCLLCLIVTYAGIWASYGFRFDAGPNGLNLPTETLIHWMGYYSLEHRLGRAPTAAEEAMWHPPVMTRLLLSAENHHLLPEACAVGLIYTEYFNQGQEDAYLMGSHYTGGELRYFPLAFLFKEPLATITAVALTLAMGIWISLRGPPAGAERRWTEISLFVPAAAYALVAMTSQMNIGYRHVFPVLPFVFIAAGVAAGRAWSLSPGKIVVGLLALILAVESFSAFPDYIAYFNVACAANRAWFLADSNLDWGQDLPALAAWQRNHPGVAVYLDYFGHRIPQAYGVNAIDLNDNTDPPLATPSAVAVSVSLLQLGGYNVTAFHELGVDPRRPPDEILGGTIYIFRVNPGEIALPGR
jgi:hypothetical protein